MAEELKKEEQPAIEEKIIDPMKELLKRQKEERKALAQQITLNNYAKLINALKALNPDLKSDDAIIKYYVLEAAKFKAAQDKAKKEAEQAE